MASRDDKARQRQRYLKGADREAEREENLGKAARRRRQGSAPPQNRGRSRVRGHTLEEHAFDEDVDGDGIGGADVRGNADEALTSFEKIRRVSASELPRGVAPSQPASGGAVVASGVVVARHRDRFDMLRDDRAEQGALGVSLHPNDEPVVVGDRVTLTVDVGSGTYRLLERLERTSVLERADPGDSRGRTRLTLAANIDVLVGVQPLSRLRPGLVDRLAVAAIAAGIDYIVCLHKFDLLERTRDRDDETALADLERDLADTERRAEAAGAVVVRSHCGVSGDDLPADVTALADAIRGKTAVLVGPSGAGKSSLANALIPGLDLDIGAVRGGDGKGRHTTTRSGLFPMPGGGALIDTPGIRAFGLEAPDQHTLHLAFPEIAAAASDCRFRDCTHTTEPDCAVRAAVEAGAIEASRLASWFSVQRADD